MSCADMDHLVFLASGNAALTRRAKANSGLSAVVVRFSRSRGRYERQGILVQESTLDRAEETCLADEDARARRRERDARRRAGEDLELQERMAQDIGRLFPGCPAERAAAIAHHAAARGQPLVQALSDLGGLSANMTPNPPRSSSSGLVLTVAGDGISCSHIRPGR
jgi:hypothetical protein